MQGLFDRVYHSIADYFPLLLARSRGAPSPQQTLDLFRGRWASRLPGDLVSGASPVFDDERLQWGIAELGGVGGKKLVELGPLEGGHTYMLLRAGAAAVTAIEANPQAYLKCLIVKELLGLSQAQTLYGDATAFLTDCREQFDAAIASGVLYHLTNPAALIEQLARTSRKVFIWTHYYDAKVMAGRREFRHFDEQGRHFSHEGFEHHLHRQSYGRSLFAKSFWGGTSSFSHWMTREDLLRCLRYFGFERIRVRDASESSPAGPHLTLVAEKS